MRRPLQDRRWDSFTSFYDCFHPSKLWNFFQNYQLNNFEIPCLVPQSAISGFNDITDESRIRNNHLSFIYKYNINKPFQCLKYGTIKLNYTKKFYIRSQGLIQTVFDIGIPILGTLIWACPNLIFKQNYNSH